MGMGGNENSTFSHFPPQVADKPTSHTGSKDNESMISVKEVALGSGYLTLTLTLTLNPNLYPNPSTNTNPNPEPNHF